MHDPHKKRQTALQLLFEKKKERRNESKDNTVILQHCNITKENVSVKKKIHFSPTRSFFPV
jgi:hypothetical protein